ncbi:hypothetical protein BDV96DRAFT_649227 [Lophiotrema nucula]|uniref:Uncharacterized protein n=1 Tax=Lophiotrema nucula TaxID=690887 RepID=A0A6A5Z214_9PLEO|nr:hypothetical protein BDV96DRAFT_649227 [Lophiotrema nucula]
MRICSLLRSVQIHGQDQLISEAIKESMVVYRQVICVNVVLSPVLSAVTGGIGLPNAIEVIFRAFGFGDQSNGWYGQLVGYGHWYLTARTPSNYGPKLPLTMIDTIIELSHAFWHSDGGNDVSKAVVERSQDWYKSRKDVVHRDSVADFGMWNLITAFKYNKVEEKIYRSVEKCCYRP